MDKMDKQEISARIDECNVCIGKLQEEALRLKEKLQAEEVTYSVADRFKDEYGDEWFLTRTTYEDGYGCALSSLSDGGLWHSGEMVRNPRKITTKEIETICSSGSFTRCWDSQRGVLLYDDGSVRRGL